MNIDERLDCLTERHQALAQSLELMSLDIAQLLASGKQTAEDIKSLLATAKQDGENIRGLVRIAEIHHQRLNALEGNADQ